MVPQSSQFRRLQVHVIFWLLPEKKKLDWNKTHLSQLCINDHSWCWLRVFLTKVVCSPGNCCQEETTSKIFDHINFGFLQEHHFPPNSE